MKPRAFVFDAYGTLFYVHSVVMHGGADIRGDLHGLSALWRQKQLEHTWLRSLMGRYEDFWEISNAALHAAARQLKIETEDAQLASLLQAYLFPSAFPDAKPALEALRGARAAILSNGSPKMLQSAVSHNGLQSYLGELISADRVKTYKPSLGSMLLAPRPSTCRPPRFFSYRRTPGMPPGPRRSVIACAGATALARNSNTWVSHRIWW